MKIEKMSTTQCRILMEKMIQIFHVENFSELHPHIQEYIVQCFVNSYVSLTPKQKEIIDYRLYTDKSFKELSEELGFSYYARTLYRRHRRAFNNIKKYLLHNLTDDKIKGYCALKGSDVNLGKVEVE